MSILSLDLRRETHLARPVHIRGYILARRSRLPNLAPGLAGHRAEKTRRSSARTEPRGICRTGGDSIQAGPGHGEEPTRRKRVHRVFRRSARIQSYTCSFRAKTEKSVGRAKRA